MSAAGEFAQWLNQEHPDVYAQLYALARTQGIGNRTLRGLGDDTGISSDEVTVSSDAPVDTSVAYDPSAPIQDISTFDPNTLSTDSPIDSPAGVSSGGGFLDALSSVGDWLVSPGGLNSIAAVGTAVLKVQQSQAVAQAQLAVINANAARAAAGKSPIPITYVTDSTGHVVPVYNTGTMQLMPPQLEAAVAAGQMRQVTLSDGSLGYAMDTSTLNSVLGSSVPLWVWLLGGGLLLAAVI
jgi:hypothetical protein